MECTVNVIWDAEACVWVATSADIDGLILESESYDVLIKRVLCAIPELLALNNPSKKPRSIRFVSERREKVMR